MKNIRAFITGLFAILIFGAAANAATWTVTKAANGNDNVCNADCSLREAVFNADSGDTVAFSPNLVGQTIALGGSEIVITKRITIDGFLNDPNVAFISGGNTSRIFYIQSGAALDLRNAILVQGNGAGLQPGYGGAIFANPNSVLSLDRVALRANAAAIYGGAIISQSASVHFANSSFVGNSATSCLAMTLVESSVKMANVTISGSFDNNVNDGDNFGAVCLGDSSTIIRNSTIAKNSGGRSGIFFADFPNGTPSSLNLGNTIVAENDFTTGGDVEDVYSQNGVTSAGGNLIGSTVNVPAAIFAQPNDITNVNPLLGPINASLGGFPVQYHPLQAGSPARSGGLNANAVDPLTNQPLTTDARGAGFPRVAAGTVDKGAFEDQSGNTSLIVTKNANGNDFVCDTDCSLREAVYQASVNFGTETIAFAPNVFGIVSTGGTEISIANQNVNIVGYPNLNANTLTVSGGNTNRIFTLDNAAVKITGMTLANGKVTGDNAGGAILAYNNSTLTLDKTIVRNNTAPSFGAIYLFDGVARITNSTISNNSATDVLAIGSYGALYLSNATVSNNFQISNRSAEAAEKTSANFGVNLHGAIFSGGTTYVRNSTISFNRSTTAVGGGIYVDGLLNIGNSIVSNNSAASSPDIHRFGGTITSVGGNLVSNSNGFPAGTFAQMNDAINVDPLLAALADNGGNVTTHSLMTNSPAINAGLNANAFDPFDNSALITDARGSGYARIVSVVDKGAFESLAPTAASATISGRVTNGARGIAGARIYLTGQDGEKRTATTNSFGYFSFNEVQVGETYVVNVKAKSYAFSPRVITVSDDLSDLNFSAETIDYSQK